MFHLEKFPFTDRLSKLKIYLSSEFSNEYRTEELIRISEIQLSYTGLDEQRKHLTILNDIISLNRREVDIQAEENFTIVKLGNPKRLDILSVEDIAAIDFLVSVHGILAYFDNQSLVFIIGKRLEQYYPLLVEFMESAELVICRDNDFSLRICDHELLYGI